MRRSTPRGCAIELETFENLGSDLFRIAVARVHVSVGPLQAGNLLEIESQRHDVATTAALDNIANDLSFEAAPFAPAVVSAEKHDYELGLGLVQSGQVLADRGAQTRLHGTGRTESALASALRSAAA
jgi:hypothetical protein